MKILPFLLLPCFLLSQNDAGSQSLANADTAPDTLIAKHTWEEARSLINARDWAGAMLKLDSAAHIFLESGNEISAGYSAVLHRKGYVLNELSLYDSAIILYEKAIEIRRQVFSPDNIDIATSFNGMAFSYGKKGNYRVAISLLKEARSIQLKNPHSHISLQNQTLKNLGIWTRRISDFKNAADYQKQALNMALQIQDSLLIANAYLETGTCLDDKGDYWQAMDCFFRSHDLYKTLFGMENTYFSNALERIANCFDNMREYENALNYHRQALYLRRRLYEEKSDHIIMSYFSLSQVFDDLKQHDSASIYIQKAMDLGLEYYGSFGNDEIMGNLYFGRATHYYHVRKYGQAMDDFRKAEELWRKSLGEEHYRVARACGNVGECYRALGDETAAFEWLEKSLRANHALSKAPDSVLSAIDLAYTLANTGDTHYRLYLKTRQPSSLDSCLTYCRLAENAIHFQRKQLKASQSKTELANAARALYEISITAARAWHERTAAPEALEVAFASAESSRALVLFEAVQRAEALHFCIPDSLVEREESLRLDVGEQETNRFLLENEGVAPTEPALVEVRQKLVDLRREQEKLQTQLEKDYPDYAQLKNSLATIPLDSVQKKLLRKEQTLLEYFIGDSALFIFVVRPDTVCLKAVKNVDSLETWVKKMREGIAWRDEGLYLDHARLLFDTLVAPVKHLLTGEVVIVPDAVLSNLPFEALVAKRAKKDDQFRAHRYLVQDYVVSYAFSATLLRKMQQKKHARQPAKMAAAFAPFFHEKPEQSLTDTVDAFLEKLLDEDSSVRASQDESLPFSGLEAAAVAGKIWQGEYFLDSAATKTFFLDEAKNYRILHLATHGNADGKFAKNPRLSFTRAEDSLSGQLFVSELYNLPLNADLVVLSACETGIGEIERGEGIISLARAFSYAGAKCVVASLWRVNDERTAGLMVDFHTYLSDGKTSKDKALALAKRDMIKSKEGAANPYFWAGFIATGDMAPLTK